MILQNRTVPVAPSIAAASLSSSGIPCSPAVTRMKVKPRLAQTLETATDHNAVSGSRRNPGFLIVGNRSLIHPMLASTPTSGWSRNSHIRLATATDVATVEEKIVRKMPIRLSVLLASTARPTPNASPSGTVISASLNVDPQRVLEFDRAERIDVLVPPVRATVGALDVAALAAEHDRPDQRVDDEHGEHHHRRCQQEQRRRQLPPTPASVADRTPRGHDRRGRLPIVGARRRPPEVRLAPPPSR